MIIADEMRPITKQSTQTGAVLFTALVMMVLMTLLAVTMMGNTAMDEFLQKTPVGRGSGFDTSFANYWFEIQSRADTATGATSTVSLGMFQIGAN